MIRAAASSSLLMLGAMAAVGCHKSPTLTMVSVERGLAGIQDEIFSKSCAYASCHSGNLAAAHLDLSEGHSCASLVGRASCLFPSRLLVAPGDPSQSFLVAKLAGEGTGMPPDSPCVGTSNARMPLGAQPLVAAQMQSIQDWIAAGADCDDGSAPRPEPGSDGGVPSSDGGGPSVDGPGAETTLIALEPTLVSVTPPQGTMLAGAKVGVTISLSRAAPADGLTLSVSLSDSSIVASPVHVFVDAGATEVTFEIQGKRPGTVQLRTGIETDDGTPPESSMTMTATITVTGLYLSEIFAGQPAGRSDAQWVKLVNTSTVPIDLGGYRLAAGVGSYGAPGPVMPLLGIIMAGSCAVIGGPYEGADNGAPAYQQMADFAPDLPAAGSAAELAAYALFDAAGPLDGKPIDAVGVGQQNGAALPGPDGAPLVPVAASIPDSQSLGRVSASAWTLGAPSPSTCATF